MGHPQKFMASPNGLPILQVRPEPPPPCPAGFLTPGSLPVSLTCLVPIAFPISFRHALDGSTCDTKMMGQVDRTGAGRRGSTTLSSHRAGCSNTTSPIPSAAAHPLGSLALCAHKSPRSAPRPRPRRRHCRSSWQRATSFTSKRPMTRSEIAGASSSILQGSARRPAICTPWRARRPLAGQAHYAHHFR